MTYYGNRSHGNRWQKDAWSPRKNKTQKASPFASLVNTLYDYQQIHGMPCQKLRNWLNSVHPNTCILGADFWLPQQSPSKAQGGDLPTKQYLLSLESHWLNPPEISLNSAQWNKGKRTLLQMKIQPKSQDMSALCISNFCVNNWNSAETQRWSQK